MVQDREVAVAAQLGRTYQSQQVRAMISVMSPRTFDTLSTAARSRSAAPFGVPRAEVRSSDD
jgi:hypothetical protein